MQEQAMPKLGFGLMRLPRLADGATIDRETTREMVDRFMAAGMRYFDTAYVYDGGKSEEAARLALVERYPRESFCLATKLHAPSARDAEAARQQPLTSLERLGTDYIDYYLFHSLNGGNAELYDRYGLWDYAQGLKESGRIRHFGFSFHDTPEVLDELLTRHPEVEFVQLQLNYADWDNPSVCARGNYETARRHGKPIVVMEPLRGGALADPPAPVREVIRAACPETSPASLALRFAMSLEGVLTVLSGMSAPEQMDDNLAQAKAGAALTEAERACVRAAVEALNGIPQIRCTSCRYCTAGCPQQINIPSIFAAMNKLLVYDQLGAAKMSYGFATSGGSGRASDCVRCGQCEAACPQHLEIIEYLRQAAEALE